MTTLVAFTVATATTPGSRPSSSAASRLMRDTTRNGPAWRSTWAMTPSRTTRVTSPVSRLRAEAPAMAPGSGASASSVARRARSAASTSRWPPAGPGGHQPAVVGPPAHGVHADAEQGCGFSHPEIVHVRGF